MQNVVDHSNEFINQDDVDCDKQFSDVVIEFSKQVEDIIAGLFNREEKLQLRSGQTILEEASDSQLLEELSSHEEFISDFCEYCHTIMKCKEEGEELKENGDHLTDEDRDEVGIQMDAMMVCLEKLKILAYERLHNLQSILGERQQTKIDRFEEWLSAIELKISNSDNIGPDFNAIQKQIKDMEELELELEQKQDFLNLMSRVLIFNEVDKESWQIRSRSCESINERLEDMNNRWTEICRFVGVRNEKLKKATSIWRLLNLEGPQLANWLKKVEKNLDELSEAARNVSDVQTDKVFIAKLLSRSDKIDIEIKNKQSFYTSLENRVRTEIEKFDDPCSMMVIELEKRLEALQERWNLIMNRKRTLDYTLEALSNPMPSQTCCNMIPLPDPITSNSNNDLRFNSPLINNHQYLPSKPSNSKNKSAFQEPMNNSTSSGEDKESSLQIDNSFSDPRVFDNSLSSGTQSLMYGNNHEQDLALFNVHHDSQDELSSNSMTISYPINMITPSIIVNHRENLHLSENYRDVQDDFATNYHHHHNHQDNGTQSCRVEEWKHSWESFSNWLKNVETSLGIESALDAIVEPDNSCLGQNWSRLDIYRQFLLLNDIENRIAATCQDEFDCLILQGQQIIQDLIPEIGEDAKPELGENKYEANLKEILEDIGVRYETVKRCLVERKREIADRDKWYRLLETLRESCSYLIEQMGQVLPETNIGVDLITLAQQQDQLMHAKADLEDNVMIQMSIQDTKLFLKLCDTLQQQCGQSQTTLPNDNIQQQLQQDRFSDATVKSSNNDIWLSFKDLKEDIESQLDRLTLHYSELSQLIEDRLIRLDGVHKEMHALQHKMQELATQLQVAEILKSNWVTVEDLSIEKLSEQLEDLKLFRERLSETASTHKIMNSIFDWMTQSDVPLSQQNLKRIGELNTIWSLIQVSVEERQKLIEQAFDNQGASEQKFLQQTIADLQGWERRVATSRVPYFIDLDTGKTHWDHPKFDELLKSMTFYKQIVFSAYRTALKLRMVQKKVGIDLLMLEQLKEILDSPSVGYNQQSQMLDAAPDQVGINNDALIGVEQIIFYLKAIYGRIQSEERPTLDVPLSIDLTLNWLLNLYDSTRTGYISALSLKVGLALICCATREEKYIFMYNLVTNQRTGSVDARKLGTLFETCMRVPIYLGEGDSFGGSEIIETSIRNCFSMSKFNPQHPNCIDQTDYLSWLKSEPQFIIWLPVLHRLLISENTTHQVRCKLCGANPIIGLRYRCLKCFKFNICQNCFLTGRHIYEHFDPTKHPMQEYCCKTSSGENVRDLTKIIRNKLTPKPLTRRTNAKR